MNVDVDRYTDYLMVIPKITASYSNMIKQVAALVKVEAEHSHVSVDSEILMEVVKHHHESLKSILEDILALR